VIEASYFASLSIGSSAAIAAIKADAPSATQIRSEAFRDVAFLTVSFAFALVLFAQVGFIVHQISFLDPVIGRERAAIAVVLLTAMAMAGRVLFSTVIDRLNQRLASAISFVSRRADHAWRWRSKSSRSSRCVNIASDPSGLHGHCSLGRSQYSSTPFSSGSRR
jgi:hypothetical protein